MTIRVFRCRECGHRLRFGSSMCGNCWTAAPLLNRRWVHVLGGAAALMVVVVVLAVGLGARTPAVAPSVVAGSAADG